MGTDSIRPERVAPTSVAELALMIGADGLGSGTGTVVTGVTLRAQSVRPGDLFAALPGARVHGASYAAEALSRGATAILTDPDGAVIVDAECNARTGSRSWSTWTRVPCSVRSPRRSTAIRAAR